MVPGITSRSEVVGALDETDFRVPGSTLVLYGGHRRIAGLLIATDHGLRAGPIKTGQLLVLSYDEQDTVHSVDLFRQGLFRRNSEVCTTTEFCIKPRFVRRGADYVLVDANVYDPPAIDQAAKAFDIPANQCAVHLSMNTNFWASDKVRVHLSDGPAAELGLDGSGYLLWRRDAASFNFVVSVLRNTLDGWSPPPPGEEAESEVRLDCAPGTRYFIKVDVGWNWEEGKDRLELVFESPTEAAVALESRRLLAGRP